jgi:hypothetical protein
MKKHLLISVAVLELGAFQTLGVYLFLRDRPGVTESTCNRIKVGMTEAEVETILGVPKATDQEMFESGFPNWKTIAVLLSNAHPFEPTVLTWIGADGYAFVLFDDNGKVIGANWQSTNQSFLDHILRWFHLR